MQRTCRRLRREGRSIGFVPTMGGLHDGHLELVRIARRRADKVIVSVFVNPTQFGPGEDYRRYPRDFARDRRLLARAGADYVFHPAAAEIYHRDHATSVDVERLTRHLCGAARPGHFRGVATVVAKLLNITAPDFAVFGRKDAQQVAVVTRMVRDLNMPVRIVVAPTVREADGLAMSSRNSYLTPAQRAEAPALIRALRLARQLIRTGERDAARLKRAMRRLVRTETTGSIDYVEIVDASDLTPVSRLDATAIAAIAVCFGRTRLIDNITLHVR